MKLVSVIIPAYNVEEYIARSIESVLAQDYPNCEIIIVDDGSSDGTRNICDTYKDRVCYIYQENMGVSAARNRGIREAKGDYVSFLDADDYYLPNKVSDQVEALNRYPDAGGSCAVYWMEKATGLELAFPLKGIFKDGSEVGIIPDIFRYYDGHWNCYYSICMNSVMLRSEVFSDIGLFNTQFHLGEDVEFFLRVSSKYNWVYIDRPAAVYNRTSSTSVTLKRSGDFPDPSFLLNDHRMRKEMKTNLHRSYQVFRQEWYWNYIKRGIMAGNLEYAKQSLSFVWTPPFNLRFLMFLLLKVLPTSLWPITLRSAQWCGKFISAESRR